MRQFHSSLSLVDLILIACMHVPTNHIHCEPKGHIAKVVENGNEVISCISWCYTSHHEVQRIQSRKEKVTAIIQESLLLARVSQLPGPSHGWIGETTFK